MIDNENIDEREKLFNEVWEKPIYLLAKQYSLSDNGLRKRCRSWDIPLPPSKYWMQKRAGKKVINKPKLPPAPKNYRKGSNSFDTYYLRKNDINYELKIQTKETNHANFVRWCKKLHVPARIKQYDNLIEKYINEIAKREEDEKNSYLENLSFEAQLRVNNNFKGYNRSRETVLAIEVSPKQRHRAYCFVDYLINSFKEQHGYVYVEPKEFDNITISFRDYVFNCTLSEDNIKRRYASNIQDSMSAFRPIYEMIPTGTLNLHIDSSSIDQYKEKIRFSVDFSDSNLTIEQQISDVFLSIYQAAYDMENEDDQKREEDFRQVLAIKTLQEEERKKREEDSRIQAESQAEMCRLQNQEKHRHDLYEFATEHMKKWNEANLLLDYLDTIQKFSNGMNYDIKQKISIYCQKIKEIIDKELLLTEIIKKMDETGF